MFNITIYVEDVKKASATKAFDEWARVGLK
jgi:hypothetical protein